MRFWDSSALIPLFVDERHSETTQALIAEDPEMMVWWASPVECASAVHRLRREGLFAPAESTQILSAIALAFAAANVVQPGDALSAKALRLLGGSLLACVENGSDLKAREDALLGACLAGQAFANSPVAAVHALAYPLGTTFHLQHGLTNALMLASVMHFNLDAAAEQYAALLPQAFPTADASGDAKRRAATFIAELEQLIDRVKLPRRLRDVGIGEEHIEKLALDAMKQTRLLVNNPRPVTLDDARAIYRQAW